MQEKIVTNLAKYGTVGICIALILLISYIFTVTEQGNKRHDESMEKIMGSYQDIIIDNTKASEGLKNSVDILNGKLMISENNEVLSSILKQVALDLNIDWKVV